MHSYTTRRLLWLASLGGVVAPAWFLTSEAIAIMLTPGYHVLRQTVSELAGPGTPHPNIIGSGFAVYGGLLLGLSAATYGHLRGRRWARLLFFLMLMYGLGAVLGGIFRDDTTAPFALGLTTGNMHDSVAQGTYGAILGALLLAYWVFRDDPDWRFFSKFSLAMALGTALFGLLLQLDNWDQLRGVYERGFFGTTLVWVQVLSLRLAFLWRSALAPTESQR